MIGIDRCVDFRYEAGHPGIGQALADGTRLVRCISLPEMEPMAEAYQHAGIRVIAVYTSESDRRRPEDPERYPGRYIMRNCSALIAGNEPQWAYPAHLAAWPTGSMDDHIAVHNDIADVLVPSVRPGLPILGAGFWSQDYAKWAAVRPYLHNLSGACVHVYPIASYFAPSTIKTQLGKYKAVDPSLPLLNTECTFRGRALEYKRAILAHCEAMLWYGPLDMPEVHALEGTPEFGPLMLSRA